MPWCKRPTAVLCVMWARVKFGSMMPSTFKAQASRHCSGRNIFHLSEVSNLMLGLLRHKLTEQVLNQAP